ncbi:hypothetical protein NL676_001161 [Syzygium grande]|nr:hypothetical protein NL676_001161 [Syzygium grande]
MWRQRVADTGWEARVPVDVEVDDLAAVRGEEELDGDPQVYGARIASDKDGHAFIVDSDLKGCGTLVRGFKFFDNSSHVTYNFSFYS